MNITFEGSQEKDVDSFIYLDARFNSYAVMWGTGVIQIGHC